MTAVMETRAPKRRFPKMSVLRVGDGKAGRIFYRNQAADRTFLSVSTADGFIMMGSPAFRVVDSRVSTVLRQKVSVEACLYLVV